MGLLRYSALIGALALAVYLVLDMLHTKLPLHFGGKVEEGYEDIRNAFEQNFVDGWEAEGASLTVFVRGRKVVDIWGGYADRQAARTWKEETLTVTFSTTKAVAAVCILLLADRGRLKYDDLVSKHWPAFAKNGKGNITIQWIMSHMAGLPYLDTTITEQMAMDHSLMREVLENEAPKFPPGVGTGYHAFTYGWLVDQIVRHTDEKRRGVGQFFREEVAQPNGIDYHIGLSSDDEHRVARVTLPKISDLIKEAWHKPRALRQIVNYVTSDKNSAYIRSVTSPSWINIIDKCTVNDPNQHAMEQAAALGIGNARSIASIFNMLVNGEIVGKTTLELLAKPVTNELDYILKVPIIKGHGFLYFPKPGSKDQLLLGHTGHGCQQVIFDTKSKIAFAYITNGLKAGVFDSCHTYARIHKAVFDTLARNP